MSLARFFCAFVAVFGLTTSAFAAEAITTNATTTQQTTTTKEVSSQTQEKLNLNKASVKELLKIKGVNQSRAKAIVTYRKKHGDFKSVSELAKVKGFKKLKPAKLEVIQNQVTIE